MHSHMRTDHGPSQIIYHLPNAKQDLRQDRLEIKHW